MYIYTSVVSIYLDTEFKPIKIAINYVEICELDRDQRDANVLRRGCIWLCFLCKPRPQVYVQHIGRCVDPIQVSFDSISPVHVKYES